MQQVVPAKPVMLVMLPVEARPPIPLALLSPEAAPLPEMAVMRVDNAVVKEALPPLPPDRTLLLLPLHLHRTEARLRMVKDLDVDEVEELAASSLHRFAADKLEIG